MAIPTFSTTNADYQTLVAQGYGPFMQDLADSEGYDRQEQILAALAKRARDQVHNLALAIDAARRTGQTAAIPGLQQQLRYWLGQLGVVQQQAADEQRPSAFLLALSSFSDDAIAAARQVGVVAGGILGNLPLILGLVLALVVVLWLWRGRGA